MFCSYIFYFSSDRINPGDVIAEIETDKAVMELEAQDSNFLAKIILPAGSQNVSVGQPIAVTVENAADVAAFASVSASSLSGGSRPPASAAAPAPAAAPTPAAAPSKAAPSAAAPRAAGGAPKLPSGFSLMGMPALSPTMESGNLVSWRKKVGDKVNAGDVVAEIETDKAVMEFEAQEDFKIAKILKGNGSQGLLVGQPIAVIAADTDADIGAVASFELGAGDSNAAAAAAAPAAPAAAAASAATAAPTPATATGVAAPVAASGDRASASPFVRKLLKTAGVAVEAVAPGSGPHGRVIARDVEGRDLKQLASQRAASPAAAAAAAPAASSKASAADGLSFTEVPHSNVRRVTAQRLTESKQQVPHYYLTMEMRVDAVMALRKRLGERLPNKPSLNDFIIKAAAVALRRVPDVNSSWRTDSILRYHDVDISMAVATERGLLTPIIQDADKLGVAEISAKARTLAERAREGKLKPNEYQGGTFTISNLGMFGITHFTAVINPPQAAILAVGGVQERVVKGAAAGQFEVQQVLTVTLSCDHRVIDGAVGAQWLQAFKRCMEDPLEMIV
jgi:pyruvate dehydrogenase E2 component (dihydrolipoamide acetyltransferase)